MGEPTQPRTRAIQRLTSLLLRRGSPRFQMMLFLLVTGLTGFLCSVLLHAAGLKSMAIRYPLAIGLAYLVFLFLLSLFVAYHRSRRRPNADEPPACDGPDGGYVDVGSTLPIPSDGDSSSAASAKGNGWGNLDLGGGDGDGAAVVVVVLIVVALGSALVASLFVLIEAPALLAEILVDGVLLVGLARRIDPRTSPHWTAGVIRRTIFPLLAVAVCFAVVGYGLAHVVPKATTMGEAMRMVSSR